MRIDFQVLGDAGRDNALVMRSGIFGRSRVMILLKRSLLLAVPFLVVALAVYFFVCLWPIMVPIWSQTPEDRLPHGKTRLALLVEADYPGADAWLVANAVAAPIEEAVDGSDGIQYMSSRCANSGAYTLTVVFRPGTDLDKARVLVQNRVNLAVPMLPDAVKLSGVTVKQKPPGVLALVSVTLPEGNRFKPSLGEAASSQIKHELAGLPGVCDVSVIGARGYGLQVEIDPKKLAYRNLTVIDVQQALQGKDGPPADPERFEDFVLKTDSEGRVVRLKDVAQVEFGAPHQNSRAVLDGEPVVILCVYPTLDARPRELSAAIRNKLSQLRDKLPQGVQVNVAFDFTPNLQSPAVPTTPEYLLLDPVLPAEAAPESTPEVLTRCEALVREVEGSQEVLALAGNPFDFPSNRPCILVHQAPSDGKQTGRNQFTQAVRARLEAVKGMTLRVRDLSRPGGFPSCGYPVDLAVTGPERDKVREMTEMLAERCRQSKKMTDVSANLDSASRPRELADVDRDKCASLGIPLADIFSTLQTQSDWLYVNDFSLDGRTWQVSVGIDRRLREHAKDLKELKVRNAKGDIIPLSEFYTTRQAKSPDALDRLGGRPMVEITANVAPGESLAETHALCEGLSEEVRKQLRLSEKYRLSWLDETPAAP